MISYDHIDISPPLCSALAPWPGDAPLSREVALDMRKGDNITLSALRASVHLGAHADAYSHFIADGAPIDRHFLGAYWGECDVIDVDVEPNGLIGLEHLPRRRLAERILFRTTTFPNPFEFNEDFAAIDPAIVPRLSSLGVSLVGMDTPSVDPFASKDLPAHHELAKHRISILEGLVLLHVEPGRYELSALPLNLIGFDASPVRAVLRRTR